MNAFLVAILATSPLVAAPSPPLGPPQVNAACEAGAFSNTRSGPAELKRLGELPPALMHMTVLRSIGGCSVATVQANGATYYLPSGADLQPLRPAGEPSRK